MSDRPPALFAPRDILLALALLTRLPVRADGARMARAPWAWPLAGVAVAFCAAAVGWGALWAGLPAGLAAGVALGVQIMATGAMHEDGLADSADGLWGGWDRARRLDIMHDSHIGTYGVIALILGLGLRWGALSTLFATGAVFAPLLAVAALSRAPMAVLMTVMPNARGSGLSAGLGRPLPGTSLAACVVALAVAALALGPVAAGIAALATMAGAGTVAAIARVKIGGQTGDILGASQQISEIAVLAVLVALI